MDVPPPVIEPGAVNESACGHCLAPLSGRHCHRCGQDSLPTETAWRGWLEQWARLKCTLIARVLRPGVLTREHLIGGRARYIAPFTLYLNTVASFFLFSAVTRFQLSSFTRPSSAAWVGTLIDARARVDNVSREIFLERADRRFQGIYTLCLSGISVVGYTLLARLFFRRLWHDWRGPFTFALHTMAFVFVTYLPLTMLQIRTLAHASAWAHWLATSALVVALGAYLALAIRRISAASWPVSIAKGVSILLLGIPINLVMFDTAIVLTLLTT